MAMDWTTPADIKKQLQRYWEQGRILRSQSSGPLFPLSLRLRKPDIHAVSERFDDVRKWIRCLEAESKAAQGFGYEVIWGEINHRQLGRNQVPAGILVPTEYDALRLINKHPQADHFRKLNEISAGRFPLLREWMLANALRVLEHGEHWERILSILEWSREHPRSGLYLRQIDIQGVDTKFIERHKGILAELLDCVLLPEHIDHDFGMKDFEQRYGLACKPHLVRFRLLDRRIYLSGLSDLTVPASDFSRLTLPVERVFIVENDINGLAFPDVPQSMVILGLGYGLQRLNVDWLRQRKIYYWGDIDTHGFTMLDRLRAIFPQVESFLMDRETLMAHREFWVREPEVCDESLGRLSPSEYALFEDLKYDRLGDHVRLEQERIRFSRLEHWLHASCGKIFS